MRGYAVAKYPEALARFMNAEVDDNLVLPVYNASPGQVLPAILDIQPGRIVPAAWGFRRPGAGRTGRFPINARSESVDRQPVRKGSSPTGSCSGRTSRSRSPARRSALRNPLPSCLDPCSIPCRRY